MENLVERVISSLVIGLVVGLVVALLVWLISLLVPGASFDPDFWGTVAGVLAGLYAFVTKRTITL